MCVSFLSLSVLFHRLRLSLSLFLLRIPPSCLENQHQKERKSGSAHKLLCTSAFNVYALYLNDVIYNLACSARGSIMFYYSWLKFTKRILYAGITITRCDCVFSAIIIVCMQCTANGHPVRERIFNPSVYSRIYFLTHFLTLCLFFAIGWNFRILTIARKITFGSCGPRWSPKTNLSTKFTTGMCIPRISYGKTVWRPEQSVFECVKMDINSAHKNWLKKWMKMKDYTLINVHFVRIFATFTDAMLFSRKKYVEYSCAPIRDGKSKSWL